MFEQLSQLLGRRPPPRGGPLLREPSSAPPLGRGPREPEQTFAKVFRWRLPDGMTEEPKSVEVVGSFTRWQPVALMHDGRLDAWHVTLHHLQGNRTHHYMLLINGQPAYDRQCDGLAVPHGHLEERYQLMTDKGPRVLMLFAQAR
jgi:hypothetical protein